MPNKYSHSGVLAQYCRSGFISLPETLHLAYIRASSIGSRAIQSQESIASRDSSSEDYPDGHSSLTRPRNVSSESTRSPVHSDEQGRGRKVTEVPQFPFSHKPNPQDRAALINSFMNEIDQEIENECHPNVIHQLHSPNTADVVRCTDPQNEHGVVNQESSDADASFNLSRPHRHDRNAWKSSYPPVSHHGNSSASLALSAASSGEYALDIPSDFPVHVDRATFTVRLQSDEPVNTSVALQDINVKASRRSADGEGSRQAFGMVDFRRRSDDASRSKGNEDKPKVPPRSMKRPPSRQESDDDANGPKTVTNFKVTPAWKYALVPSQKVAERPRNSSRSRSRQRNQQKNREDSSLLSISDSVSATRIAAVNDFDLSSDFDVGGKISEHPTITIPCQPLVQAALPAGSITLRQPPHPPAIGSNEIKNSQPRRGALNRPVSAMSSDTQIYAPLSSTFPADLSYTDKSTFIPEPNVIGPGHSHESDLECDPGPSPERRSQSRGRTDGLHAPAGGRNEGLSDSSASVSDSGSVGILSAQPGLTMRSTSQSRSSKYTPVYRDRKQEWLDDPNHSVGHYRAYLLKRDSVGHRRFASGYSSSTGSRGSGEGSGSGAQRFNSLPNMIAEPQLPMDGQESEDLVDGRPVSVLSEASASASEASSGFYPPDIARYREEKETTTPRSSVLWQKRVEDSAGGEGGGGVGRGLSSSGNGKSWRKKEKEKEKEKEQDRDQAGQGLLRRLRGVSLSGIR